MAPALPRTATQVLRAALRPGREALPPDLRDLPLQRRLPRVGHRGGAGLPDRAGEIRQGQRAIEGRFGEAVDNQVPVRKALAIDVAIIVNHGRALNDLGGGLRLLGQGAVDHVQPPFDPGPLGAIAHREQAPAPQPRLDLQPANAEPAGGAEAHRDRTVQPSHPVEHPEHGIGDGGGKRFDKLVPAEFFDIIAAARGGLRSACVELGKFRLRDPDRIVVTHAQRHQPRDFAEQGIVEAAAADETLQAIDIELGIAGALIIDQPLDAFASDRRHRVGQAIREKWRRGVVIADEIGEQIADRGPDACHFRHSQFLSRPRRGGRCCVLRQPLFKLVDVLE